MNGIIKSGFLMLTEVKTTFVQTNKNLVKGVLLYDKLCRYELNK
jgi:hypothetical protein